MAANTLGRAYIEVHADTKPFARELLAEVEAITKLAENQAGKSGQNIGRRLGEGIEEESDRRGPGIARRLIDSIRRSTIRMGGRGRGLFSLLMPNFLRGATRAGTEAGTRVGASLAGGIATGFADGMNTVTGLIGGFVRSLGSSIGNVGSAGPFALAIGVAIIALIPAIIGAVISLASALSGLLYLLLLIPGAIAGLVAAILPVVLAFKGFGAAVSAVVSGDPKQITEAFKNLAPAARTVAREMAPLVVIFKSLGKIAQQAFFEKLIGSFKKLSVILGPLLTKGFDLAAGAAGEFAAHLIALAENPQVQQFFASSFIFAAQLFKVLGPPLLNFITALTALSTESFPTLLTLFGMLGGVLNRFAEWIQRSIKNGDFDRFMDKLLKALDNVDRLLSSSWDFIKSLLGGPDQQRQAQEFFDQVIETLDALTRFFKSPDGKKAIDGMITSAKVFLTALYVILLVALEIVAAFQLILDTIIKIINLIPGMNVGVSNHLAPRTGATSSGGGSVSHPIGHARGGVFDQEHIARIAEGDRREVIIPMTDPRRARDIANRSGLTSMLDQNIQLIAYIGDEQVTARIEKRVGNAFKQFGRQMKYGPRTVGVGP